MRVAILVPMLGRHHRVAPLLESVHRTTPDARVLFCLTPTDRDVRVEVERLGAEHIFVPHLPIGDYQRKIQAGFDATDEPLIFTGADDLLFHEGWLKRAAACLQPGVGVVGTNDLANPRVMAGEHSTHSLITREYVDRYGIRDEPGVDVPGKVLCDKYPHEFTDDELIETARYRGAFVMALDSHVEHLHPNFRASVPVDRLYSQQRQRMRAGRPIYLQRQHLWT